MAGTVDERGARGPSSIGGSTRGSQAVGTCGLHLPNASRDPQRRTRYLSEVRYALDQGGRMRETAIHPERETLSSRARVSSRAAEWREPTWRGMNELVIPSLVVRMGGARDLSRRYIRSYRRGPMPPCQPSARSTMYHHRRSLAPPAHPRLLGMTSPEHLSVDARDDTVRGSR